MGKIKCDKCGKEISPQGFKTHYKYCNGNLKEEKKEEVKEEKKNEQGLKNWILDKPKFHHLL